MIITSTRMRPKLSANSCCQLATIVVITLQELAAMLPETSIVNTQTITGNTYPGGVPWLNQKQVVPPKSPGGPWPWQSAPSETQNHWKTYYPSRERLKLSWSTLLPPAVSFHAFGVHHGLIESTVECSQSEASLWPACVRSEQTPEQLGPKVGHSRHRPAYTASKRPYLPWTRKVGTVSAWSCLALLNYRKKLKMKIRIGSRDRGHTLLLETMMLQLHRRTLPTTSEEMKSTYIKLRKMSIPSTCFKQFRKSMASTTSRVPFVKNARTTHSDLTKRTPDINISRSSLPVRTCSLAADVTPRKPLLDSKIVRVRLADRVLKKETVRLKI